MTFAIIFESVGVGEWFVLLAVILIVVGPKRLPSTARKFGQYYSKFRRAADSFKRQLLDMDREFDTAIAQAENAADETLKAADIPMPPAFDEYGNPIDETSPMTPAENSVEAKPAEETASSTAEATATTASNEVQNPETQYDV